MQSFTKPAVHVLTVFTSVAISSTWQTLQNIVTIQVQVQCSSQFWSLNSKGPGLGFTPLCTYLACSTSTYMPAST